MLYNWLKVIHISGAILCLGNIMVTAWWKNMANRTGDPRIIAFAQRQVTITDFLFTFPGAVMLVATGDYAAYTWMPDSWSIRWLTFGRLFFIASGCIWLFVLIPIQVKQARMARSFVEAQTIPSEYWRLSRYWNGFGAVAVLLPLANIYWMVFKPM